MNRSCRQVLDMPFRHYVIWAYPFSNQAPRTGTSYTGHRAGQRLPGDV